MTQTDPEVVRRLTTVEQQMEDAVKPEVVVDLISPFLALPGLRLFVPMSSSDSAGDATDLSGLAHHLTYNGNPTYNVDGLAPYIDLDGTGDFLSHADHADFDVLGTETTIDAGIRGLLIGGWFWFDAFAVNDGLITKSDGATVAGSSYQLVQNVGNTLSFTVFAGAAVGVTSAALSTAAWYFVVGRYIPSTTVDLFINNVLVSNAVAVPAAINNTGAPLNIGAVNNNVAFCLDGRVSRGFLCAAAHSDATIAALFQQTRGAYGV